MQRNELAQPPTFLPAPAHHCRPGVSAPLPPATFSVTVLDIDSAVTSGDPYESQKTAFAVAKELLELTGGEPVQTIRATVGSGIDRGTLQPQTFDALGVRGTAFVSVVSDCTWALVMLRVQEADPGPSTAP